MSLPRLHAPREHGQILAVPPLDQVSGVLERNRAARRSVNTFQLHGGGKSLNGIRALAREEVLAASAQYHREAGESVPDTTSDTWLVAGHQPELFHPGVWFKNFALNQLARAHGTVALNVLVDTDAAKPPLLTAPADGRVARIAYDRFTAETPYEERVVEEEVTFAALPAQIEKLAGRWPFEPLMGAYWAEVMQHARRTPLLGERLAAGRRALERRWGCVQREVPMSRVCRTESFAWFAWSILERLPAFHQIYNEIVHDYRRANGIRSRSHPVPDLTAEGDWFEAPFWAWRAGQSRRGRLMVRQTPGAWALRVGREDWPGIPSASSGGTIDAWRALETQGFKIRSRALTTTMFARLFLADLFIHGIGGGLYDALTDHIVERFYGIPAPGYLVLSATLLLPLPRYPDASRRVRELEHTWRDIMYKPERFAARNAATAALIDVKQQWIASAEATHAARVERYHRIRELNARLLAHVMPLKQQVEAERLEQQRRAQVDAVAARRDYAFCLYPEEMLRRFFMRDAIDR